MVDLIETERLMICALQLSDASFILQLLNSEGWLRFIGDKHVKTIEEAEQYIKNGPLKSYATYGFGLCKVIEKSSMHVIGVCGFLKRDFLDFPDIGYAFLPNYQGHGYAFEAANAICKEGVKSFQHKKMYAVINEENIRSVKLIQKLGFMFERSLLVEGKTIQLFHCIKTS